MSAAIAYEQAYMALPSSLCGGSGLRGTVQDLRPRLDGLCGSGSVAPLMIFLAGSNARAQDRFMADAIVEQLDFVLVAPNTHARPDRPRYQSPATRDLYDTVHRMRREEVSLTMDRLRAFDFLDWRFVVLAGLSEGAVTAATWDGTGVTARIAIAWNCESSYFVDKVKIAGDPDQTPFLNLNGYKDQFFGPHSELGRWDNVRGHGAEALSAFKHAKVVIYPDCGHRVLENAQACSDITHFLRYWKERYLIAGEGPSRSDPPFQQQSNQNQGRTG